MTELEDHAESMDMFSAFIGESRELSIILKSHLFAEMLLDQIIHNTLVKPSALSLERGAFAFKVDLAEAIGAIDAHWAGALRGLNNVRNDFAHKKGYTLSKKALGFLKVSWNKHKSKAFAVASKNSLREALVTGMFFYLAALRSVRDSAQQQVRADVLASGASPLRQGRGST